MPGMIVAAKALLDRNPDPSDDEIRAALATASLPLRLAPAHHARRPARRARDEP